MASCGRRSGKSSGAGWKMLEAGFDNPKSYVVYIHQARERAKDTIWLPLQKFNDDLDLGLRFRENDGSIVFPNKSRIVLFGAGSKREVDKMRGVTAPLVVVDEAQGYSKKFLEYMLEDVIEPLTMDFGFKAQVLLTGTPNAACAGHFYDLIREARDGGENGVHEWTALDNPHMPDVEAWLAKKRTAKGWADNNPTYLREYMGQWIRDADSLVFKFCQGSVVSENAIPDAPDWNYTLGLDLGFNDPTAFVVLAYSPFLGRVYVVESYQKEGLIPSAVAAHVQRLDEKYHFARIVADTGGYGKGIAEELAQKYHMPVQPAQKRNRLSYLEMLNGDLANGTMRVLRNANRELIEESSLLQWDADKLDQNKYEFDRNFADHLSDAFIYGYRECYPHSEDRELNPPTPGSAEWNKHVEDSIEKALLATLESEKGIEDWFY